MVTMLGTPDKVSIFNDGVGDAPFNDPLTNLSFVKFDSTFEYLPNLPARTIGPTEISIPATLPSSGISRKVTLGAHGQAGVPFIYGMLQFTSGVSAGLVIPLVGTVAARGPGPPAGNMISWTLGVDETDVFLIEDRSIPIDWGSTPGRVVTVYVFDKLAG